MFHMLRCKLSRFSPLLAVAVAFLICAATAQAEATGPDAWRVWGNKPVTIWMGPGHQYPATGTLARDTRHLKAVTCVPLFTNAQFAALARQTRNDLPPRWCLIEGGGKKGWVAQRHLREDTLVDTAADEPNMPGEDAVAVARAFFADYNDDGSDKLYHHPDWARQYFYTGLAAKLARDGLFDGAALYPGQDSDIADLRVRSDPTHPPLRGMTTVLVTYRDWGQAQQMRLYLRSDPDQGGAQRIIRIETADGRTIE